jgi:hypothetical protein
MIRSRQDAERDLAERKLGLLNSIREALREYVRDHASLRHRYSKRTQASIIHDLMVSQIKATFDGKPGVAWHVKNNAFEINFDDKYKFRLKKFGPRLLTRNIPTQAVIAFEEQEQMDLPTLPSPTNVHLGYKLNDIEIATSPIWITCPGGWRLTSWAWELTAEEVAAPVLPVVPEQPAAPTRRVVIRQPAAKSVGDGNESAGNE